MKDQVSDFRCKHFCCTGDIKYEVVESEILHGNDLHQLRVAAQEG